MRRLALATLALCAALAPTAHAHEGNPNFESIVTSVEGAPGLRAQVLNGDDRLLFVHEGTQTVVIEGYEGEPYARMRPGGVVEVNQRSTATYLNDDRFGEVAVPDLADNDAEPRWEVVNRRGRFEFHDHRMHWMAENDPPSVRDDRGERQKVFDWRVPLQAGGQPAAVAGTLWWRGSGGGAPVAMFAGLGVFALLAAGLVIVVRRRRAAAPAGAGGGAGEEAW